MGEKSINQCVYTDYQSLNAKQALGRVRRERMTFQVNGKAQTKTQLKIGQEWNKNNTGVGLHE